MMMDSVIIWIYFRISQPPISFTAAAPLFKDTLAITLANLLKQNLRFSSISFKGHLMWILLPWRHFLLLSLVVLVVLVVVVVAVVVMVVVVIVQVSVTVVVKSWPELVNNKLETRATKYKFGARGGKHIFGARAVKYKLGARAGKHKLGPRAGKYESEARAGKYKLGAGAGKYKYPQKYLNLNINLLLRPLFTYSESTIETPKNMFKVNYYCRHCSGVFTLNFEHMSHLAIALLLFTMNKWKTVWL